MKRLSAILWLGVLCAQAHSEGVASLQFEQTIYDFGKVTHASTVAGVFKFKNVGDGVLKLEPPKPSCGCTVAELKPDTLIPGATGELPFTLNLGLTRAVLEKHIAVRSNDPNNPEITLTIKVDFTPLYELIPQTLAPNLAFGVNDTNQVTTISRTDGKALQIVRMEPSKSWIKAVVEPGGNASDATARIRVSIQRDGPPRRFNEYIHIYGADQTNSPVASLFIYGQLMGEVSLSTETLYWSIIDTGAPVERPDALITRRVTVRSTDGKAMELKNLQSSLKGMKVEFIPKQSGTEFELVAKLNEVPGATVSGTVSFETSVPEQSRIEVPVIVNVFKP